MSAAAFYRGSTTISPHRQELKSHGELTATMQKTKELAQDVQDAVEQDFTLHCRVADTKQFLDRLLPVEATTVDAIFQSLKVQNLYDSQTQRWVGFPEPAKEKHTSKTKEAKPEEDPQQKNPQEKALYGPFTAIAEAIRQVTESKAGPSTSKMGRTNWIDYHSKSPKSTDNQAAQLRPDVLFALRTVADLTPSNESQERQEEEDLEEQTKREEERHQEEAIEMIWWLQIIAAIEMKRHNSQKWLDVVKQLFGYLRRILREQLDRRFVFGLTLGPAMMTVWLHDRSGVIGTKTSIDIHKDPASFIQVIAAFSLLSPEKLGFDPTIKLLVSPDHAVPSYMPNEDFIKEYQTAPHNRRWVITMNDGTQYVTVETVSSVRSGFMRGRGSIVWVVVPFKNADESKFFVLKQSWRPREVDCEGKLYGEAHGMECNYVGRIELWEDVLISCKEDSTDALIRQALDDSTGLGKRSANQRTESTDPYIHVTCTDVGDIREIMAHEAGPPVARVRTRVVLSTYGWLIKYFSTRRELLVVLQGAIRGHKHLYERGVLHRDISPGNILIKWRPSSEADQPSASGCLIDLDHAKKGKASSEELAASSVDDDLDDLVRLWCSKQSVETDVARHASRFFPLKDDALATLTYLKAVLAHRSKFRIFTERLCTPQHLLWKPVNILYNFDFLPSDRQKGSRTGTPPYTSGEVLLGQRYFHGHRGTFHDATHDLESFFWVLVHICITRRGPGGFRREELEQKNQDKEEYQALRRVVHCFFDSDMNRMAMNKREIFLNPHEFDQFLLDNFHGYFKVLRGLVKEWFHLLVLSHQFHAFEYHDIHDMVLDILDRSIASLPPDDIDEAVRTVLDDRKVNIKKLEDGNPFGKVQHPPAVHTSPSSQRQEAAVSIGYSIPSSPTPAPKKQKCETTPV